MAYQKLLSKLENSFNIIYPDNNSATYSSVLNFSDDLTTPIQRWCRYKEGFSLDLVKTLISNLSRGSGKILDPFAGSGSTMIGANLMQRDSIGFEVNPFSYFLATCKTKRYEKEDSNLFKSSYETFLAKAENLTLPYELPELSISNKVFSKEIEEYLMTVWEMIQPLRRENIKVYNLLKLGWLACIEPLSNYRKAGNGLKKKKYVKPRTISKADAKEILLQEYSNIYDDITTSSLKNSIEVINSSCLEMDKYIPEKSIDGIIFSPPYANCFDYTEIYKLELWFGHFVESYNDMRNLRKMSLRSHLNSNLSETPNKSSEAIQSFLQEVSQKNLWDKKIPKMLELYYSDMFNVISKCYNVLKRDGFCCIVIGNSAYGGTVVPADLLCADFARSIGFNVENISIDRYIITSSQQYAITQNDRKFLRESVVCLRK